MQPQRFCPSLNETLAVSCGSTLWTTTRNARSDQCMYFGMAIILAQKIADIKQLTLDDLLVQMRGNVREMYGI